MAFARKVWKDRLVEFAGRRLLKRVSGSADSQMVVDVTRNEGTVSQAGDAFSAANMNDLEQRIADEFGVVNQNITNVSAASGKVNLYVGADGKLHFVNSAGADTAIPFSSTKTLQVRAKAHQSSGVTYFYVRIYAGDTLVFDQGSNDRQPKDSAGYVTINNVTV